jgi:regulator of nucleoside diphosphate kinase
MMSEALQDHRKPQIVVSDIDYKRLTTLATAAQDRAPEVSDELLSEMERAAVVSAGAVPPSVVQMKSIVTFRSDGQDRRVILVFPGDADIAEGKVSIMTPIGTALIGLSPGQSITWKARDGRVHELTVLTVDPPDQRPSLLPKRSKNQPG